MSVRMTLGDFLNRIEGVYKSIDIRIAAVKSDDTWHNALIVVRFSYVEPKDVEEQQKQLQNKWGKVQTSNFQIEMQAWPLATLETLSDLLEEGKWLLFNDSSGVVQDLQFGRSIDLLSLDGRFERHGYTRRGPHSWPCFEAFTGEHCYKLDNPQVQSEVKSQTYFDLYSLISELFEINFHKDLGLDLIVNAPFYAMIENVDFSQQKCLIQVKFHKDVKALAVSAIVRRGDRGESPVRDKASSTIKPEEAEELDEYMRLWTKELELPNATPADHLFWNLMQTEPGLLDIEKPSFPKQISRFAESKKPAENPLLAAFRRFCTEGELENYLTKPGEIQPPSPNKPSSAFEGFVSWILGLCGFQSIWLGWTGHETLKEGKVEHLRLDILAYYEKENTLLLVACTTGRPDQDIDIVNSIRQRLYADVFKDTSIQIRGFIFSSQPSVDVAKQLGEKAGVMVFGAEDIKGILNCIRTRKMRDALACFGFTSGYYKNAGIEL